MSKKRKTNTIPKTAITAAFNSLVRGVNKFYNSPILERSKPVDYSKYMGLKFSEFKDGRKKAIIWFDGPVYDVLSWNGNLNYTKSAQTLISKLNAKLNKVGWDYEYETADRLVIYKSF